MCDDDNPENWEEILADTPEEFKQAILKYAKENLIKMHLFISSPFTTAYQRYIETTKINFIANVGGKCVKYFIQNIFKYFSGLMGLCMGFSFVSLTEIIYYFGRLLFGNTIESIKNLFDSNKKTDVEAFTRKENDDGFT